MERDSLLYEKTMFHLGDSFALLPNNKLNSVCAVTVIVAIYV